MTWAFEQVIMLGTVTGHIGHCAVDRDMPVHFPLISMNRNQGKEQFL